MSTASRATYRIQPTRHRRGGTLPPLAGRRRTFRPATQVAIAETAYRLLRARPRSTPSTRFEIQTYVPRTAVILSAKLFAAPPEGSSLDQAAEMIRRRDAVLTRLADLAKADERIAALWLQGSLARGDSDPFSD